MEDSWSHWPLYSTGPHSIMPLTGLRICANNWNHICQVQCELVLQGHDHVYSRTKSILDGQVYINKIYVERKYENGKYLSVVNQKGTTYLTGGSSGTKFYYCQVPERFDGYFEVFNGLPNSMFTVISVSEKELLVRAYIYDHENDKVILHDIFGFTNSYANLQTMAKVREEERTQGTCVGIVMVVSLAAMLIPLKRKNLKNKSKRQQVIKMLISVFPRDEEGYQFFRRTEVFKQVPFN